MTQWPIATCIVIFAAICFALPLRWALKARKYALRFRPTLPAKDWPPVLVVLPCRGQANEMAELEDNLRTVLAQDYPAFRVVFAVTDPQDVAMPVLRKLCQQFAHARVVVAEAASGRSDKISNQLRAIQEAQASDEVLAFLDSDARPAPTLLRKLVGPLRDPQVGTTTGFRWYTPSAGSGFGSWLRSAWNAGGLPFLVEPRHNYAWGGAMAIRRDVFEKCKVGQYWAKALSDDLGLSLVVKRAGYRITLVPDCLVRSPEDLSLRQTIEWSTRQTVVCRVYNPVMWRDILLGELATMGCLIAAMLVAWIGMTKEQWLWAFSGISAFGGVVVGWMLYQMMIVNIVRRLAPELASKQARQRLILLAPLVHPLILYNSLRSLFNRRIEWRGVHYHLRGPQDIVVIEP